MRNVKRLVRAATDRGWLGRTPLEGHVVVCGFPRAGTTLLDLLVRHCVADVWGWHEEVPALTAALDAHRNHRWMCTKDPRDVHRLDAVRDHYATRRGELRALVLVRDPRDVLTSTHAGYPPSRGYYCETSRWRAVWQAVTSVEDDPDVAIVRYEDLVQHPDAVQARLTAWLGWEVVRPFASFPRAVTTAGTRLDAMTRGALGGLRPLDERGIGRWQRPEHADRLAGCRAAIPELDEAIARWGADTASRTP